MRKPTIYLAGAIRDERRDDIAWREEAIDRLSPFATMLNPLGGKSYDPVTKTWKMSGVTTTARAIVKQDYWCVDRADIIIANLTALDEKYPNIGTLCEFGRASGTNALVYTIVERDYTGHENTTMFRLHPFIEENSTMVFFSVDDCLDFLEHHLKVLAGIAPRFVGIGDYDDLSNRLSEEPGNSGDSQLHQIART